MSLKKQIADDFITAFKARTDEGTKKKNILGELKAEITKKEQKETKAILDKSKKEGTYVEGQGVATFVMDDEEILKLIQKTIKNANETIELAQKFGTDNKSAVGDANFEISVLEVYLPKQMTEEEIDSKIKEIIDGGANNIGQIMGAFAKLDADKKIVSEKARAQLA